MSRRVLVDLSDPDSILARIGEISAELRRLRTEAPTFAGPALAQRIRMLEGEQEQLWIALRVARAKRRGE